MKEQATSAKTKIINVRTTEDDFLAIQNFARFQGKSVSAFIMDTIWEKIEEWEDLKAIGDYEDAKARDKIEYVSWEQVQKNAGLL